jgi:hypothetical protein
MHRDRAVLDVLDKAHHCRAPFAAFAVKQQSGARPNGRWDLIIEPARAPIPLDERVLRRPALIKKKIKRISGTTSSISMVAFSLALDRLRICGHIGGVVI